MARLRSRLHATRTPSRSTLEPLERSRCTHASATPPATSRRRTQRASLEPMRRSSWSAFTRRWPQRSRPAARLGRRRRRRRRAGYGERRAALAAFGRVRVGVPVDGVDRAGRDVDGSAQSSRSAAFGQCRLRFCAGPPLLGARAWLAGGLNERPHALAGALGRCRRRRRGERRVLERQRVEGGGEVFHVCVGSAAVAGRGSRRAVCRAAAARAVAGG